MGEEFLIDTNVLIYYLADAIPKEELPKVEGLRITTPLKKLIRRTRHL